MTALSKSFCICNNPPKIKSIDLNSYICLPLGDELTFYGSHDLRIHKVELNDKKLIIVGICIDVKDPCLGESDIAKKILSQWDKSRLDFEKSLFSLAGSYIIIVFDKETYVYPDACSTYSVSYSKYSEDFAVSSHPRLVAEIIGQSTSSFQEYWTSHKSFSAGGQYYPGNITEFDSCLQLTPNTFISSKQHRIPYRFYPIEKIKYQDINSVLKRMDEIIDAQVTNITSRFKINASLSGGLDSRVTLAAFKNHIDKINFFTYNRHSAPDFAIFSA